MNASSGPTGKRYKRMKTLVDSCIGNFKIMRVNYSIESYVEKTERVVNGCSQHIHKSNYHGKIDRKSRGNITAVSWRWKMVRERKGADETKRLLTTVYQEHSSP